MENSVNVNLLSSNTAKVTITPCQPKTLTNLPERPPVDIAFSDLKYTVTVVKDKKKQEKTILKSVSGRLRSGELTAIMGPSGAGKSTLLNILTGYRTTGVEGSITINGYERNLNQFRKLSCYIMQDNQLHGNLTVKEAMNVAASLKLSSDLSKTRKEEIILEILDTLGLEEHKATFTSNLSGGQKKRLSVALELVNNPPIMFFDEPTSGLDSSSCHQCIALLKSLSIGGRTIICTIHQPSATLFEMFDHLYAVAEGQCIYQGSTQQLVPFFKTLGLECPGYHNPAAYLIEVASGEYGENVKKLARAIDNGKREVRNGKPFPNIEIDDEQLLNNRNDDVLKNADKNVSNDVKMVEIDAAKSSKNFDDEDNKISQSLLDTQSTARQRYPTSELAQMWIVLKRTFLFNRRDRTLMYMRLISNVLIGALIGVMYYDIGNDGAKVLSNLGFLFFNQLFLTFSSMTITILSFPLEMPVLVKEHFNRWYSLRAYYLAITVSDLPFQALFSLIYASIVYWVTSQPPEAYRFGLFFTSCLLLTFVGQSIGLIMGAAMDVQRGVFLAPMTIVPFTLFSGFFIKFSSIALCVRWVAYVSYIRYSFEGAVVAIYGYDRAPLDCFEKSCHFKDPKTLLKEFDMTDSKFEYDAGALIAIFLILRIGAFVFLRMKLKSQR